MDCVVCNKTGATYRLVGGDELAVCEQCVAEHLTRDVDNDTCLYCERPGDYDLAEDTGAVAGSKTPEEYEVVTEGVVCRDHVSKFRREES
jgi:hypothetical protein